MIKIFLFFVRSNRDTTTEQLGSILPQNELFFLLEGRNARVTEEVRVMICVAGGPVKAGAAIPFLYRDVT